MKKLLIILLIIGVYLHFSYAYFYNFLGQKNLVAPAHEIQTIFPNNLSNQTIKYASLGDSLTVGVGASSYKNSFPYLLAQKLSAKDSVELFNFGQAGAISYDVLIDQVPKAIATKPDLITVLIGVNDIHNLKSPAEFKDNYIAILNSLKNTDAKIYLLSIPYLGSSKIVYFPYNFILDLRTRQFNDIIKQIADGNKIRYINLYLMSKTSNFYSADEFHPKDEGYKEWLEAINVN